MSLDEQSPSSKSRLSAAGFSAPRVWDTVSCCAPHQTLGLEGCTPDDSVLLPPLFTGVSASLLLPKGPVPRPHGRTSWSAARTHPLLVAEAKVQMELRLAAAVGAAETAPGTAAARKHGCPSSAASPSSSTLARCAM